MLLPIRNTRPKVVAKGWKDGEKGVVIALKPRLRMVRKRKFGMFVTADMENMPLCPIRKTQNDSKIGNDFKNC